MKPALPVLATCFLVAAGAALADDAHDHSAPAAKPPAAQKSDRMPGMHEHMKLMREQMAQIRAAKDPKERERLVNAHMTAMEESMAKMSGMMGCGKM